MKIAVIFGVFHMSLGICIKGVNAAYNKNRLSFFNEFLPQIIMLLALFGYMDLMIIIKWCTNYFGMESKAPSIITTVVDMFLDKGKV